MSVFHQALRLPTVCVASVPKLLTVGCQCRHSSHLRVDKIQAPKVIIPIDPKVVDPEGLFSAPVLEFIEARHAENKNGKTAIVTDFFDGRPTGMVNINNFIFNTNARIDIIHQVVVWQRACARRGTASTKTRAEVRGGGRKPWPQKGTGRARQGSIRAPQWRGGGVVHGPKPRSYAYDISPKVIEYGLRAALSCRFAQGDFYLVDNFDGVSPYEEDLVPLLERNGWNDALLVDGLPNKSLSEATALLRKVHTCSGRGLSVLDIMRRETLVMSLDALRVVEDYLARWKRVPTVPNKGMAGRFNPNED